VTCQLCGGSPIPFWSVRGVPTSSCSIFPDAESARALPLGDLALEVCPTCGFIQNAAFSAEAVDYLAPYEESQASSPTFQRFAEETINTLLDRYPISGGTVLEVGCGKAEWLAMMCKAGDMQGIGIDPAYVAGRVPAADEKRFEVLLEFFGPGHELTGDLVACRHTLEHIPNVAEFTRWLAKAATGTTGSTVFVEVPDTERILAEGAFWDMYYEHCAYFTITSMANLASETGLSINDLRHAYSGQYLLLEATPGESSSGFTDAASIVGAATAFASRAEATIERWREEIASARLALWGATSKTVGFITATGAAPEVVVDINPAKQGTFLPGSGARIVAPEALVEVDPDLIVVMNPIYLDEIRAAARQLGSTARLAALGQS